MNAPDADVARAVAETGRLRIRRLHAGDAAFIVELLNDPSWIQFIGDKSVRTQDDALRYLEKGPIAMYARHGFGLYAVDSKANGETLGMCGLIKRDALDDVDLGFAFLPRHRGEGFALESANAVTAYGFGELGLRRIVAIVSFGNTRSDTLLRRLGFDVEGTVRLPQDDEVRQLYALGAEQFEAASASRRKTQ